MKRKIIIGLILILLVILQSTVFDYIKIFNAKPDLMLIAIIIISLYLDLKWVMIFGYVAGFLKDMLATLPIGLNALVLPLLGFLVFRLSKRIVIETNFMIAAIISMAVILENLIVLLLFIPLGLDISIGIFFRLTIIGSIYTASVFLLASKILFHKFRHLILNYIL